jgi:hypothetical protein
MAYRYKTVKRGGKTVLLHRWMMEQHLGRKLRRDEEVHHKNEDRWDNRIENFELKTTKSHQAIHHPPIHPVEKTCAICTAKFTPHKTKRKRQQTCSWTCRNALIVVRRYGVTVEAALRKYRPEVAEAVVRANLSGIAREAVA